MAKEQVAASRGRTFRNQLQIFDVVKNLRRCAQQIVMKIQFLPMYSLPGRRMFLWWKVI